MGFTEGVPAGNQRDRFVVVHSHAAKSLANIAGGRDRIRIPIRAFRVYVDQAHLNGGKRILQFAVAGIAFVAQPLAFRTPIDVFFRLPNILTATSETEGL